MLSRRAISKPSIARHDATEFAAMISGVDGALIGYIQTMGLS